MNFSQLTDLVKGQVMQMAADRAVTDLVTDSRKAVTGPGSLFFAIDGARHDGHTFIGHLYAQGLRQFVTERDIACDAMPGANVLKVKSAIEALQQIAQAHRVQFGMPVIGITGSNGKTIVKEWLYQLLSREYAIVKNPGSYNSQIGVPLSVWNMQPHHQLGIFEAGISTRGEMARLEGIIRPTVGIFTNAGTAHDEGFAGMEEKIHEKLLLFGHTERLIYCRDHTAVAEGVKQVNIRAFSWGRHAEADVVIRSEGGSFRVLYGGSEFTLRLPFTDPASAENCFHCVAVMLYLQYKPEVIRERIQSLRSVAMRLELKDGINQCQVIDDSYNNDLQGLQISLDFLTHQQQKKRKRVILSDVLQSGLEEAHLVGRIAGLIGRSGVDAFVGIGPVLFRHQAAFGVPATFYPSADEFLDAAPFEGYRDEMILIKGARPFRFERIVHRLQRKVHGTTMEIDLGALVHNLNYFRSRLAAGTRMMVMVKAFAYGSGSVEVANVLQYHMVDYLGVAYPDEGVELRKHNITIPVMVMNPSEESFGQLLAHRLEPEIYSFRILHSLIGFLNGRACTVHIKIDTGMHRLGFDEADMAGLAAVLKQHSYIHVASVFSHLAGADEAVHDGFSRQQGTRFLQGAGMLADALGYKPLFHILNSPGILRLPELHLDMVRLGIGLYGIDPTGRYTGLRPVATLKTIISQVRSIRRGETVSYGRSGKAAEDMTVATLALGYADGFSRAFSNGVGQVLVNGKRAPVIGNVCMDMTMVDVTGIDAAEGDEVVIFGHDLPIGEVAASIHTIPYEILTNTSERVKRVFVAESI